MDEFDFNEPKSSLIETKPELIPLLCEIHQVGFCKDVYDRGEAVHPGIFKDIDPKMLSMQHSSIKRTVAMEAFGMDDNTSNLVVGGVGVAAAGVLAMGIFKLYKWFRSLFSKEDEDPLLDESAADSSKKAEEALDKAAAKAEKEPEPADAKEGYNINGLLRGKPGRVKMALRQIWRNMGKHLSESEAKSTMETAAKSKILATAPLAAIAYSYQGGVPAILGIVSGLKIDNTLLSDIMVYSRAYYVAAEAMFDYSMAPTQSNLDTLKKAINGLRQSGAIKPGVGKVIGALENGNIPTGDKKVSWKGPIMPDSTEAKPITTMLEADGISTFIHTNMAKMKEVIDLPREFLDASGSVSDKLDVEVARQASEKIKDAGLTDHVREIHKGLVRATKIRNLCRQLTKSLAKTAACNSDIAATMDKYVGK